MVTSTLEARAPPRGGARERLRYCGQVADSIRTDVTVKLVDVPMLDADGLVACPGCVLLGRSLGALLDVSVPDGLPVVPVVVLGVVEEASGLPNVPVTSTWCPT
jgi:hypothetical protein